jgi:hypothetical protein
MPKAQYSNESVSLPTYLPINHFPESEVSISTIPKPWHRSYSCIPYLSIHPAHCHLCTHIFHWLAFSSYFSDWHFLSLIGCLLAHIFFCDEKAFVCVLYVIILYDFLILHICKIYCTEFSQNMEHIPTLSAFK